MNSLSLFFENIIKISIQIKKHKHTRGRGNTDSSLPVCKICSCVRLRETTYPLELTQTVARKQGLTVSITILARPPLKPAPPPQRGPSGGWAVLAIFSFAVLRERGYDRTSCDLGLSFALI